MTVHRAAGGEVLVGALARVLARPPDDPFAREVVAVPAKGVERWIAQRLSHTLGAERGDGVCANVEFPWPGAVLDAAVRAASAEHAASVEAWAPSRLLWPLIEVADESLDEPAFRTLAHHLGGSGATGVGRTADGDREVSPEVADKGRRVATLGKLARLYDEYGQTRPRMLQAWAAGRDETGDGALLADDLRWQAELWRRVQARVGVPAPAQLLQDACAQLVRTPDASDLPARLSVFGASRLSPARLRVLAALAAHREVHLWLHHPSPALWEAGARAAVPNRRLDDEARVNLRNPLLASMSRDLLELQYLLRTHVPGFADVHHEPTEPRRDTLLGALQQDLADDAVHTPRALTPGDRSVQVHSCHGRTRQVEVLREVVLGLLRDDPTLEPRDVLVMCPDVEAFAPLVAAAFSLGAPDDDAGHPAARLRVRLADRALQQTNALLDALSQVLALGTARITAPEVLDLAGLAAVRRRFGFDEDALERLREWVVDAGVRWGLDPEHRAEWRLSSIPQGTWRSGLDRLLLGVAMEGDGTMRHGVVPVDDVDSSDIELAGRLAELVDRLHEAQTLMSGRHPIDEWLDGLERATLGLAETTAADAWQLTQLSGVLDGVREAAAGGGAVLGLADVRSLLASELAGRPSRSSFRTGTLTVCTLVPMRSVPHRVICLLGLDDGTFPRQSIRDGDDVLARAPWVGERDPRSEDRQLLLDAVGAAGEHLVITYSGADERTGASIPPAVPLGELLDALDRTATVEEGCVRAVVTTRHPLQPFDTRNFTADALDVPGPFSFDTLGLQGAVAARGSRTAPPPFLAAPLGARALGDVDLADLRRLLLHPARGFLRQRLEVAVTRIDEEPGDALSVEYDSLQAWALGERLLAQRLGGMSPGECVRLERLRGLLPPGPLGTSLLQSVGSDVDGVVAASCGDRAEPAESHDVDVPLPDGTRLTGTVGGVRGDVALSVTYSRLSAKHRLAAWLDLVALSAARPGRPWRAVAVGRDRQGSLCSVLGPLPPGDARLVVAELVELHRSGLRSPLPLPLKSSAAYAAQRFRGTRVAGSLTAAAGEWEGGRFPGENADDEHALVYGEGAALPVVTATRPHPGEAAWYPDEPDRFGVLSRRLWDRLLASERQERR